MTMKPVIFQRVVEPVDIPFVGVQYSLACGHIRPANHPRCQYPEGMVRCYECEIRRDVALEPRAYIEAPLPLRGYHDRKYHTLDPRELVAIVSDGSKFVSANHVDGRQMLLRYDDTLGNLWARLPTFWRIHRGILVNAEHVQHIERYAGVDRYRLGVIANGRVYRVARRDPYRNEALQMIVRNDLRVVDVAESLYTSYT